MNPSNHEWVLARIAGARTTATITEIACDIGQDVADSCDYTQDAAGMRKIREAFGKRRDGMKLGDELNREGK